MTLLCDLHLLLRAVQFCPLGMQQFLDSADKFLGATDDAGLGTPRITIALLLGNVMIPFHGWETT